MKRYCLLLIAPLLFTLAFSTFADAATLSVLPTKIQRLSGEKARVLIYVNGASSLISMGIRVSFDPTILQVDQTPTLTGKNVDFTSGFVMDADGDPATTADQYTNPAITVDNINGTVTMIGGRLIGSSTSGLSGQVLLGSVVFNCVGNGVASLTIDLAKYHPNHPTQRFDNFVNLGGEVDEPTNAPAALGWIFVGDNACRSNFNGDNRVNAIDLNVIKTEFGRNDCNAAGRYCNSDINGDGRVNALDLNILKTEFGRNNCPTFP